jgi:transcriptional regulator with XRE-family HTH domain
MGKECTNTNENIYFQARKQAAKYDERLRSRESAADLLGVSISSLADYELGNTKVVPVDKVVLMADLYHAPQLKTRYCKDECPIGKMYSLAKDIKSIESIALGILSKLDIDELSKIEKKLIAISADGKVDKGEMRTLQEIRDYFSSLQEKISELSLLCDKGKADEDDGWC